MGGSDAAALLHLTVSLNAGLNGHLTRAVQAARADGLSWAEVADLLGTTRASAWQHFSRTDMT